MFSVVDSDKAISDADSTPTVVVYKNGTLDAWAPTVANVTTGLYKITDTVPSGYAADDVIVILASFAVDGASAQYVADRFVCEPTPLTTSAIATAVGAVSLDTGVVLASPSPSTTVFGVSGTSLNAIDGAYSGMAILFTSGSLAGVKRTIQTHAYTGGAHSITLASASALPAAPAADDAFVIG